MLVQLTALQARVIGVLMEKEITTPDQYPLSLNALTLGCNQKSSREPIMQLTETEVQNVLDELRAKNLLFEHQSSGSRVTKYKHRFCNTEFSSLQFTDKQLAIICVLLLRGPQTPGELRSRTNRLAEFDNVNEVEATLLQLGDFHGDKLLVKLNREAGKRESRYAHLFCGELDLSSANDASIHSENSDTNANMGIQSQADAGALAQALQRIDNLEENIEKLNKQLADMQETLDILAS